MPNLRTILFGARDKNYVDVTALSAPSRRKAPSVLRSKSRFKPSKRLFKVHLERSKAGKVKAARPSAKKGFSKKAGPKALTLLAKIVRPSPRVIKPLLKPKKIVKAALPQRSVKPVAVQKTAQILAGDVTHFFDKIQVCVIKLKHTLKVGDRLHFKGRLTSFTQILDSMQINHQQVMMAKKGSEIGLKVAQEVRVGDQAFLDQ